jgi:hypothetical protein
MIGAGAGVEFFVAERAVAAVGVVKVMGARGWNAGNVFKSVPYDADGESMLREVFEIMSCYAPKKGCVPQRREGGCHKGCGHRECAGGANPSGDGLDGGLLRCEGWYRERFEERSERRRHGKSAERCGRRQHAERGTSDRLFMCEARESYLTGEGAGASATEILPAVRASVGIGFAVGVGAGGDAGHALRNAPKDMNEGASDSMPNDGDMTSAENATGGGGGVAMTLRTSPTAGGAGNAVSSEPNERDADIENDEEAEAIMVRISGVGEGMRVRLEERTQGATATSSSDRRGSDRRRGQRSARAWRRDVTNMPSNQHRAHERQFAPYEPSGSIETSVSQPIEETRRDVARGRRPRTQ